MAHYVFMLRGSDGLGRCSARRPCGNDTLARRHAARVLPTCHELTTHITIHKASADYLRVDAPFATVTR